MTAQIIDFAQKQREKREREFLAKTEEEITQLSPEELKNLQISLRAMIIDTANERGEITYEQDGYTVVMDNGMAYHVPHINMDAE